MPPVASPIAWTTIEDALYDWLAAATGLTTIWAEQDSPQPAYPYAVLEITSGPTKVGGQDEQRQTYDGGQSLGQEIGIEVCGLREITLSVQVFAKEADALPTNHPRDMLSRAQSSLGLPSVLQALKVAGLSVIEEMPVQDMSEAIEDTWITRAAMDVRLGLAASVTERTGYISTVEVDLDIKKPDGTTSVDAALRTTFTIGD